MAAIEALRSALSALGRNPVLFLVGLLYGVITLPQSALQLAGIPMVPTLLQILTFFVTPFVIAGLLGMASESLDGKTSFSTLTRVGKDRYVPLLVGSIIEFAIFLVFGIVAAIVGIVAAFGVFSAGGGGAGGGAMLAVGALVLVVVLVGMLLVFFIQFYSVAIVVGGTGAIDGFRESYRLVRNNLVSALGYSVINFVVSLVTTIPISGFLFWRTFQNFSQFENGGAGAGAGAAAGGAAPMQALGFSTQEVILISVISLATTMLLFTFQRTYATAFYRAHEPRSRPEEFAETADFENESEESAL
ncbi:DUF7847 domain-containing protein [Halopelagius longus]|uniref:DUF7847 domain-containing protein n=1 Tax=Halopelagius longus TaxID=1236180 RepID=A0A1H1C2K9_9EURY|nr:hypothetical protein [Halopelagius longus]RDI71037.1 hypothetical protein DWB78_04435 [Halopelagius longus]SDQ58379.1 hypothetical protein SAMN05216278_2078 [Halopelagius longus]